MRPANGPPAHRPEPGAAHEAAEALRAAVAAGLAAAAGRHGFATRRRRFDIGHAERRRRAATRRFALVSFVCVALLPALAALFYYGWLAEDRYVAETRFLLRVNKAATADRVETLTGLPSIEMKRDTQVIASYLSSPALLSALEARAGLRAAYEGPRPDPLRPETWIAGDWLARLAPGAPAEDLLDYWERRSDVSIELPAGIVVFSLEAFAPGDAARLTSEALALTEALVNDLNARVWAEAVSKAEGLFRDAADRLAEVQGRLAVARNRAGLIDAGTEAGMLTGLAAETRSELIRLEQERAAAARHLAPASARMQALDRRIGALRDQLAALGQEGRAHRGEGGTLADVMADFSEIEVARELAERQFLAAARKLEQVGRVSEARMMYLDVFVPPALPEEATRPRRALWAGLSALGALGLWGALCGAASLVRNHMA